MSSRFSKKIAYRYLWSGRSDAFIRIITIISVLGVAIGVMVLTIVMAVMTGFEHELKRKVADAESHISVQHLSGKISNWQELAEQIAEISGIIAVSPVSEHQALMHTPAGARGLYLKGILPGTATAKRIARYVPGGSLDELFLPQDLQTYNSNGEATQASLPGIVIGRELARILALRDGTPISLIAPQVGSSPFGLVPRSRRFLTVASYSSGLIEYEKVIAYVSLEAAQRFFRFGDAVSSLEIVVDNFEQAPMIAQRIYDSLGQNSFIVHDWTKRNEDLWNALRLEKKVYFIVLLLIIIMASFSIVTTLVMLVLEKRKDIAILKTIGATGSEVSRIFVILGSVIGLLGTTLGLLLGFLGCIALREYGFPIEERVFQMSTVPVKLEPINFVLTGVAALLICFLATIYPSRRAMRMQPCEILRYE